MSYLIRISRRDKPHSRTEDDNTAQNNSCPGSERANFNYRKIRVRKSSVALKRRGKKKRKRRRRGGKRGEGRRMKRGRGEELMIRICKDRP
jgi:hypothetical protein